MDERSAEHAFLEFTAGIARARNGEGGSEKDKAIDLIDRVRAGKEKEYNAGEPVAVARVTRAFELVFGRGYSR